jgi:hypothetical protein
MLKDALVADLVIFWTLPTKVSLEEQNIRLGRDKITSQAYMLDFDIVNPEFRVWMGLVGIVDLSDGHRSMGVL